MPTLYTNRAENIRRTWMLLGVFVSLVAALGWMFSRAADAPYLFPLSVGAALIGSVTSYWFSDRLVIALTRARPIAKRDDPELYRLVENLSIAAGLPLPKLYLIDDPALNAFATGRNAAHAVVAVTRGLRQTLEKQELEGVLAHELSHIGNRDMLVATVAAVLAGAIVTIVDFFLRTSHFGGHRGRRRDGGTPGGAVFAIGALVAAILAPLAVTLLRLAVSRQREFLADASSALLTRYPEGLARALEKISAVPFPVRHAPDATAHLWIAEPKHRMQGSGISAFARLFLTHPSVSERIRRLRQMHV